MFFVDVSPFYLFVCLSGFVVFTVCLDVSLYSYLYVFVSLSMFRGVYLFVEEVSLTVFFCMFLSLSGIVVVCVCDMSFLRSIYQR